MSTKSYSHVLDAVARDHIPDDVNLLPRIAAKIEKGKGFPMRHCVKILVAVLFALLVFAVVLVSVPDVANAMRRLFGYIPGIGVVDQSAPLRVLAEPVSQTRDGITLTVIEAVLSSDKTVVVFTLENVPWEALSHDENIGGCYGRTALQLPDGTRLQFTEGSGRMGETRFVYAAIPADVNEATFVLPCIMNTLPGLAPENWELPLRFIPAPPDLTLVPVIEIQPTPSAETPASADPSPMTLTKAMQIGDQYVLLGTTIQPKDGDWMMTEYRLIDANGKEVFALFPTVEGLPYYDWGFQFKGDGMTFPVTLTFTGVQIVPDPNARAEFEFDAGENPLAGQEWTLNQDIQIGGRTLKLVTVRLNSQNIYSFEFECDPDVTGVSLDIPGYTPMGGGGGGGYGSGKFSVSVAYTNLPKGKLKVVLSNLNVASAPQAWQIQWSPENPPASTALYGISLKLDKFIPLDDGYYLMGHTEWADERITDAFPMGWNLKAYDVNGQEVPFEPADWQEAGLTPKPGQWLYKLYGKAFAAPISLRAAQMGVTFKEPVRLTLDLRPYGFEFSDDRLGAPWKTGLIPLDVPGLMANAFKATYVKEGDLRGFEIGIEADPALRGLSFRIVSGLDTTGSSMIDGAGGSNRDEATGLVLSRVLTNARITFPLVMRADGATVNGKWETTWNPPAAESGATPVTMPEACVTLDKWKQAAASSAPMQIPPEVPDKVLLSRGAISPEPSLFISTLDGSSEQALVFGQGALSPDGAKLVYSGADNRLYVLKIASGASAALTSGTFDMRPFWSPDGTQIAFTRQTDKGLNVFVMDADGQNARALTDTTDNPTLIGWTPDSQRVIVTTARQGGGVIQSIDIMSNTTQNLIETQEEIYSNGSISPDGSWMAYADKVPGRMTPGIFIARLDGSEMRLLVQLDYWMASLPLWSPDGKWLAVSVMNTDLPDTPSTPALVNVQTCQVIPLLGLKGEIQAWAKP